MVSLRLGIYNSFIDPFPGFWLNCIGIILSIIFVFSQLSRTNIAIDDKVATINGLLMSDFSEIVSGSTLVDKAADNARFHIQRMFFETPEMAGQFELDPHNFPHLYAIITPFVESLKLRYYASICTADNIDEFVIVISSNVNEYFRSSSELLNNRSIFYVWIVFSMIYLIIVAVSYFGNYLSLSEGEPIFNIIDIGLYLSLVEYSGGFNSPVIYFLSFSILVTIIDGQRIISNIRNKYSSIMNAMNQLGLFKLLAMFSASLLYIFVLSTGLFWASIDTNRNSLLNEYIIMYFKCIGTIIGIGLIIFITFTIINSLISKQNQISNETIRTS